MIACIGCLLAAAPAPAQDTSIAPAAFMFPDIRLFPGDDAPDTDPSPVNTSGTPVAADAPLADKWFRINFEWKGWDGIHYELVQRTPVGDPLEEIRGNLGAKRLLYLDEAKLAGKIGGRFAFDLAAFRAARNLDDMDNGFEVRRARIYFSGDAVILVPVSYRLELGYIPNPSQFHVEESYLAFKDLGFLGSLKLGQFRTPFSLDAYTSTRDISFMEPAAPVTALAPGVNAGVQVGNSVLDERMTWAFGMFADGAGKDFGDASKDYGRAVLRLTGLPFMEENPIDPATHQLLHLGLNLSWLYSGSSTVRFRTRPESHLASYVLDTGDIDASNAQTVDAEIAWVDGPFSFQSEYLVSFVEDDQGNTRTFYGGYIQAGYFLTGESRAYIARDGKFGRLTPKFNFDFDRGGGAWEVVTRLSYTSLSDNDTQGGRMTLLSAGVNWYPQSHVHWAFDFITGAVRGTDSEGWINAFQTRIEFDF